MDGFVTLRATQLHGREKRYATKPPPSEKPPSEKKVPDKKSAAGPRGIGRTVMPTQNEIVCYACNFSFVMRGKAPSTQCPKCGARLALKDETITGAFSDELVTAGKVKLTKGAILDGGKIMANDIVLEGTFKSGELKAHKSLELAKGAVLPESAIDAQDLIVGEGASFDFHAPMKFKNVEIRGEIKADIYATGQVQLYATGHYLGKLKARHFTMEDGAGLNADVHIEAPPPAVE